MRTPFFVVGLALAAAHTLPAQTAAQTPATPAAIAPADIRPGRILLQAKQFQTAKHFFEATLKEHPGDIQAQLGLGDAELALHQYTLAEANYRAVVTLQPELWQAHKNLVIVEAALGRWEEFDGERTVLRLARRREAPGISPRESDVIDSFNSGPQHWVVRAYFEPVGRSETVYNFERFSPSGRVEAYISLENAAAAEAALHPSDLRIGTPATQAAPIQAAPTATPNPTESKNTLALNWYTGTSHGTIARYPTAEPTYEHLRATVLTYLRTHTLVAPLHSR